MAFSTRSYARPFLAGGGLPRGVKNLIIANSAVFLLMWLVPPIERLLMQWFSLVPADVVTRFFLWELVTYLFLHGGFFHVLFNMLALWFFG
jgi:membrane associated rhomboid family serine protease